MAQNSKFEYATLDRKNVANQDSNAEKPAFKSIFSSLREDLLQSQELLRSREEAAANIREQEIRKEVEVQFQTHHKMGFEEGYAKGFAAKQSEHDTLQQSMLNSIQSIQTQLSLLISQQEKQIQASIKESISLAKVIAKKVIGRTPSSEFFDTIESCLLAQIPQLIESERLKISVHTSLVAPLKENLASIMEKTHFSGKCIITASSEMQEGDCLIEWEGGAIKKNRESLEKMIDTICEQASHSVS